MRDPSRVERRALGRNEHQTMRILNFFLILPFFVELERDRA